MKIAWNALLFGFCVQAFAIMVSIALGVSPMTVQSDVTMMDPSDIVDTWDYSDSSSLTGDLTAGLTYFWDINVPFIESFFIMADNMGCPEFITRLLKIPWRAIWNTFVIEIIIGRRIFD